MDADLTTGEVILGKGVNIAATASIPVGSAVFYLNGVAVRTESAAPYALFGDNAGDFTQGDFDDGDQELTVEFFSEGGGQGVSLGSQTITFVVAAPADGEDDGGTVDTSDDTDATDDSSHTDAGPQAGDFVLAVNAGGGAFTASDGVAYQADTFGAGGSFSSVAAIAGTLDDAIYQSETWGNFTYNIELPRGTYDVELNFAEIWGQAASAGQRVFDIRVEGKAAVENLDLSGAHGFQNAVDFIGQVEVMDGFLTIEATGVVQNAKLSGFSVWQASGNHGSNFSIVGDAGSGDTGGGGADISDVGGGDTGSGDTGSGDTGGSDFEGTTRAAIVADGEKNRGIEYNEVGGFTPEQTLAEWADYIVYNVDGNNNDEDDVASLPVAALLAAAGGLTDKIEFLYGNNFMEGTDDPLMDELVETAQFAESLGIRTMGYEIKTDAGYQRQLDTVVDHLANIFNSGQKVLSIEGGPMEAVYRALERTDAANLENVVLLSHSEWNEDYRRPWDDGSYSRNWHDIKNDFAGVAVTEIRDQNWGGDRDSDTGFNNRFFEDMRSSTDPVIRAARDVMDGAQKIYDQVRDNNEAKGNDASDAGMMWYALTGQYDGTAQDALAYLDERPLDFVPDADFSYIEDPDVLALFA